MPAYPPVVFQLSIRAETDKDVRLRQAAVQGSRRSYTSDKRPPTGNHESAGNTARRVHRERERNRQGYLYLTCALIRETHKLCATQ
jgi:hypothetical protein